jgi:hypothetical protein
LIFGKAPVEKIEALRRLDLRHIAVDLAAGDESFVTPGE